MPDDVSETPPSKPRSKGLLQPGRLLVGAGAALGHRVRARALGCVQDGKGAARDLGLGGGGPRILVPATLGVLAALALYVLSVRLVERRWPDELALARLGPELAAGLVLGAALFAAVMGVLLAIGAYALTGPTIAPAWNALAISLSSGVTEELVFRGVIFRLLWSTFGSMVGTRPLVRVVRGGAPGQPQFRSDGDAGHHLRGRRSARGALHPDRPAVGIDRLPHRLELHAKVICSARKSPARRSVQVSIGPNRSPEWTRSGAAAHSGRRPRCRPWFWQVWPGRRCSHWPRAVAS